MRITIHDESELDTTNNRPVKRIRGGMPGPYSKAIDRGVLGGEISGRSKAGRFLKHYETELAERLFRGKPSVTQRMKIARCARLALHLELLDQKALAQGRPLTGHDMSHYNSYSNAWRRQLAEIERDAAQTAPPRPTLADILRGNGEAA